MLIVVMRGGWPDDSVLDTVVISGEDVSCSVVFGNYNWSGYT